MAEANPEECELVALVAKAVPEGWGAVIVLAKAASDDRGAVVFAGGKGLSKDLALKVLREVIVDLEKSVSP